MRFPEGMTTDAALKFLFDRVRRLEVDAEIYDSEHDDEVHGVDPVGDEDYDRWEAATKAKKESAAKASAAKANKEPDGGTKGGTK